MGREVAYLAHHGEAAESDAGLLVGSHGAHAETYGFGDGGVRLANGRSGISLVCFSQTAIGGYFRMPDARRRGGECKIYRPLWPLR